MDNALARLDEKMRVPASDVGAHGYPGVSPHPTKRSGRVMESHETIRTCHGIPRNDPGVSRHPTKRSRRVTASHEKIRSCHRIPRNDPGVPRASHETIWACHGIPRNHPGVSRRYTKGSGHITASDETIRGLGALSRKMRVLASDCDAHGRRLGAP